MTTTGPHPAAARGGAPTLRIEQHPYGGPASAPLIAEVQQEYVVRYGAPDETPVDPGEFVPPHGTFYVAWLGPDSAPDQAVGCAGLRRHDAGTAELKRMYVRAAHRGRGLSRPLLAAVEEQARRSGYRRIILETGTAQPEAIGLYTTSGYMPVPNFGHYRCSPSSRCFGKEL